MYERAKRVMDVVVASAGLAVCAIPLGAIALLVKCSSPGPVLYWSKRVGKDNRLFDMVKFRTMSTDAPTVATHLLSNPNLYVTRVGRFLRRTSLDELPQLFHVLTGDMSLVGPRPALYNQDDLIALRTENGIHRLTPGLTGWSQVNGRDELSVPAKVSYDKHYLENKSVLLDARIVLMTIGAALKGRGVSH